MLYLRHRKKSWKETNCRRHIVNVFDIIGPVMIGPSSSHTAGAVRLGNVAYKLMDAEIPEDVEITLSGSFARTGQGHGTDRALMGGIMGFPPDDARIRDALQLATERGIHYRFRMEDIPGAHPNTARISYKLTDGREGTVEGASIGGGNIRIDNINGMSVDFTGERDTILVLHRDRPGVIANVTNLMREKYPDINICSFQLSRMERGGEALMTIETDTVPAESLTVEIRKLPDVLNALLVHRV